MVTINLPRVLQRLADSRKTIEATGLTVDEALKNLCNYYKDLKAHIYYSNGKIKAHILLAVNGSQANSESPLKNGDSIEIIIASAGGLG